ncbi:hypothetical protein CYMTET_32617, partial [Cymbomonas tetramitiformis]
VGRRVAQSRLWELSRAGAWQELLEALNSDFMWRTTSDRGAGPCAASTPTSTAALLDEPPLGLFPMARVLEGSRQGLKVSRSALSETLPPLPPPGLRRGWCTRSVAAQWCTSQIGGDEGVLSKQLDSLEAGWRASERALHANRTHVKAMMDTNRRQHTAWDAHMADVDAFQARLQWEREALDASESELRSRERALNESWQVQLQELEAEGTRLQQEFEEAEEQESQAHWVYADQLKLVKAQRVNQTLTALQLRREKLEEAGSLERESRKEESTVMLLQKEMHVEEQEAVVQSGAREHYELLNRMKDVLAVNRSRLNTKDKNIMDARNAEMLEGVIMDA